VCLKAKDHFEDTDTDVAVLTKMEEELVWIHKGALGGRGRATTR